MLDTQVWLLGLCLLVFDVCTIYLETASSLRPHTTWLHGTRALWRSIGRKLMFPIGSFITSVAKCKYRKRSFGLQSCGIIWPNILLLCYKKWHWFLTFWYKIVCTNVEHCFHHINSLMFVVKTCFDLLPLQNAHKWLYDDISVFPLHGWFLTQPGVGHVQSLTICWSHPSAMLQARCNVASVLSCFYKSGWVWEICHVNIYISHQNSRAKYEGSMWYS